VIAQPNPGITFEAAQRGYHDIAAARRKARDQLSEALTRRAQSNFQAAKANAVAFAKYRAAGKPVEESKILAKADSANHVLDADMADVDVKTAQARLDELEGERSSLRQLADWTREESGS
jgi:hypothetical protein